MKGSPPGTQRECPKLLPLLTKTSLVEIAKTHLSSLLVSRNSLQKRVSVLPHVVRPVDRQGKISDPAMELPTLDLKVDLKVVQKQTSSPAPLPMVGSVLEVVGASLVTTMMIDSIRP